MEIEQADQRNAVAELAPEGGARFRIDDHSYYRPTELERVLGRRKLEFLRKWGLSAQGGWYFGENVLEAERAARKGATQEREDDGAPTQKKVENNNTTKQLLAVPRVQGPDTIRGQLEAFRKEVRAAKIQGSQP